MRQPALLNGCRAGCPVPLLLLLPGPRGGLIVIGRLLSRRCHQCMTCTL